MDDARVRLRTIVLIVAAVVGALGSFALGALMSDDSARIEELVGEVAGLRVLTEAQEADREEMLESVAAAESSVGDHDADLGALQTENAGLRTELSELMQEVDALASGADAQADAIADAEAEVADLQTRLDALRGYFAEELDTLTAEAQRLANTHACNSATAALEGGPDPPPAAEIAADAEASYDGIVDVDVDQVERELRRCGSGNPSTSTTEPASGADTTSTV